MSSGVLSGILSGISIISSGFLSGISSDMVSGILFSTSSDIHSFWQLRSGGSSRSRSSGAHCDRELVVEKEAVEEEEEETLLKNLTTLTWQMGKNIWVHLLKNGDR